MIQKQNKTLAIVTLVAFMMLYVITTIFPHEVMIQTVVTVGIFALPALVYSLFTDRPLTTLGFDKSPRCGQWFLLILFIVAVFPAMNMLEWLNGLISLPDSMSELEMSYRQSHAEAEQIVKSKLLGVGVGGFLLAIFTMSVLPAVCEEMFFRSFLQGWMTKKINVHASIVVVSLVFSFLHFDFYGFIPRLVMSLCYGYIFYFTRSIWSTILAHFVNNTTYIIVAYLQVNTMVGGDFGAIGGTEASALFGMLLMLISFCSVYCMQRIVGGCFFCCFRKKC